VYRKNTLFHSFLSALAALLLPCCLRAQTNPSMHILNLHENWQFHQSGQEYWMPASVPGTVHTDLIANRKIEDPYYRTNERDVQWVDKTDWEYRLEFTVDAGLLEYDAAQLEFLGLDTYADVYLNDSLILQADNFFVAWEKEVKNLLQPGKNSLRILFHSPVRIGLDKLAAHGFPLPASNDQSENGGLGDKAVSVFLRKPGYHFGWDWGPRLVSIGIWRPVQLRFWNKARLRDVFFRQDSLQPAQARLTAVCEAEVRQAGTYVLEVRNGDTLIERLPMELAPGHHTLNALFHMDNPQLWWTRELGTPHLYPLQVRLLHDSTELDRIAHAVGLRTVRVVREPDAKGESFYVELNGRPVFSKGANYIPNDVFLPRVTRENYRRLVSSAVDANMNMLRIWGGGFYEEDYFYQLCDENGILIWQDFMFACSMYPGDQEFLENVEAEAVYNVRRLRNHPCIALWCGNNEIDIAWANFDEFKGWGWKQQYNKTQRKYIWDAYYKVFHQMLPAVVGQHHPGIFYWPSSPYFKDGEHAGSDTQAGDIHYWGVWHGEHPFSDFYHHIGRFMSEYGFQSFPELRTVKAYTEPGDWDIESEVMAAHQRSGIGNLRIRSYMKDMYQVPQDFAHILYVGQVLQAEGMKMAVEAHRAAKPHNMGTLYWQINDCWPVASWSGMDYYQRWKATHYFVKDAFAPVTVSAQEKDNEFRIQVVSDLPRDLALTLELRVLDFAGKTLYSRNVPVQVPDNGSVLAAAIPAGELRNGKNGSERVLEMALREGSDTLHRNLVYFQPVKHLKLPTDPGLKTAVLPDESGEGYVVLVSSERLAKNVYLDFPECAGFFSDNYFDLLPGESVQVRFKPDAPTGLGTADLQVLTIADTLKK
jgi:beta-mannosidase